MFYSLWHNLTCHRELYKTKRIHSLCYVNIIIEFCNQSNNFKKLNLFLKLFIFSQNFKFWHNSTEIPYFTEFRTFTEFRIFMKFRIFTEFRIFMNFHFFKFGIFMEFYITMEFHMLWNSAEYGIPYCFNTEFCRNSIFHIMNSVRSEFHRIFFWRNTGHSTPKLPGHKDFTNWESEECIYVFVEYFNRFLFATSAVLSNDTNL